jgi:hypothetical protein
MVKMLAITDMAFEALEQIQLLEQKRLGYKKPYKIIASEAISKLFASLLEKEGGE